jgi:transposase-like protein
LEGEVRDKVGRERYERADGEVEGYRNGYRRGRMKTAEGMMEFSAPQVRDTPAPFVSAIRESLAGRTQALEDLAVELYARGLSTRDNAATLPSAISCFEDDFEACIAHLRLPVTHRRATRTTNLLERLFVEERRRPKIIPNGFGEKPVLKLMPQITAQEQSPIDKSGSEFFGSFARKGGQDNVLGQYPFYKNEA